MPIGASRRAAASILLALLLVSVTGCESLKKHVGAIGGAVLGGVAGALVCDKDDRLKCAVAGAGIGATLGYLWDRRQQRLRTVAKKEDIDIAVAKVKTFNSDSQNGLALAINDNGMFPSGSYKLTHQGERKMRAVAAVYREKPQSILVVGHTDAVGNANSNLRLSQLRARTVARVLVAEGLPKNQIFIQGVGESQPIASNDTAEGRAANRRVEIIEVDSTDSIAAYSLGQQSNLGFLAHSNKTTIEKKQAMRRARQAATGTQGTPAISKGRARKPVTSNENVATQQPSAGSSDSTPPAAVNFGGWLADQNASDIEKAAGFDSIAQDSGGLLASVISPAQATNDPIELPPCYLSNPRTVGGIRNFATGDVLDASGIEQSDYWPGLNGNVWIDQVNGNLVALTNLRAMAESGSVVGTPTVRVYKNYAAGNTNADYSLQPHLEAYKGPNGLLLRSYFDHSAPIECMDVVMPNYSQAYAKAGVLYYSTEQGVYQNNIKLHRLKAR